MSENALVLAVAMMFIGPALNPILGAKGLRIVSFCIGAALIVAFEWADLRNHIDPQFRSTLSSAASNAYVWLAMLSVTWLYIAVGTLTAKKPMPRVVVDFGPDQKERGHPLPDSFIADREHILKEISHNKEYKAQLYYGPTERCSRLANQLNEILLAANWTQPPPQPLAPDTKTIKGIYLRSALTGTGHAARLNVSSALTAIGVERTNEETPDLRNYDYCFIYITE